MYINVALTNIDLTVAGFVIDFLRLDINNNLRTIKATPI